MQINLKEVKMTENIKCKTSLKIENNNIKFFKKNEKNEKIRKTAELRLINKK